MAGSYGGVVVGLAATGVGDLVATRRAVRHSEPASGSSRLEKCSLQNASIKHTLLLMCPFLPLFRLAALQMHGRHGAGQRAALRCGCWELHGAGGGASY